MCRVGVQNGVISEAGKKQNFVNTVPEKIQGIEARLKNIDLIKTRQAARAKRKGGKRRVTQTKGGTDKDCS